MLEPTALTCAPSASHSRWTIGSRADVAVTTTSAPRTASSTVADLLDAVELGGVPGRPAPDADMLERQHGPHRVEMRPALRPGAEDRERLRDPARASSRVATAETAAVRIAVIAPAFMIARVAPVSPSKSATKPWWLSSPRAAFPGTMQTVFSE